MLTYSFICYNLACIENNLDYINCYLIIYWCVRHPIHSEQKDTRYSPCYILSIIAHPPIFICLLSIPTIHHHIPITLLYSDYFLGNYIVVMQTLCRNVTSLTILCVTYV